MTFAAQVPSTEAMPKTSASSWWAALSAFVLWALLAAGGAWMVLQGWPKLPPVTESSVVWGTEGVRVGDLRRVLQASAAPGVAKPAGPTTLASNVPVKVLGVIATASGQGAALLQIGQEPPKPYAPGAEVKGVGVVQSVTPQAVRLGASVDGPATLTLVPPKSDPPQH